MHHFSHYENIVVSFTRIVMQGFLLFYMIQSAL